MEKDSLCELFMEIIGDNIGCILSISRSFTTNRHDREDLVSDIMLELWNSFQTFRNESKVSTWLYRVALNTAMNNRRKKNKHAIFSFLGDANQALPLEWLVQEEQDTSDEVTLLYECIDALNEINKALILLYLNGNSYDEIAEVMGMSKTNVGTRLARIKETIRTNIPLKK
jgi:RNA polymerase sigma-70 factor (ECF subfamily)